MSYESLNVCSLALIFPGLKIKIKPYKFPTKWQVEHISDLLSRALRSKGKKTP